MHRSFSARYDSLFDEVFDLYHLPENKNKLLFHGWHHIEFVHDKAIEFAEAVKADIEKVAVAALVHDLNYIFTDKLEPEVVEQQRQQYLTEAGYDKVFATEVGEIIENAHMAYRGGKELSLEGQCLSDADTLFKALPITPILFASKFITQNKYDIEKLAHKVIDEQEPVMQKGIYFYTDKAKKEYMKWAVETLQIWKNVLEALQDPAVKQLLKTANELEVL